MYVRLHNRRDLQGNHGLPHANTSCFRLAGSSHGQPKQSKPLDGQKFAYCRHGSTYRNSSPRGSSRRGEKTRVKKSTRTGETARLRAPAAVLAHQPYVLQAASLLRLIQHWCLTHQIRRIWVGSIQQQVPACMGKHRETVQFPRDPNQAKKAWGE